MIVTLTHNVRELSNGYEGRYVATFDDGRTEHGSVDMAFGSTYRGTSVPHQGGSAEVGLDYALRGIDRFRELIKLASNAGVRPIVVGRYDITWDGRVA